MGGRGRKATWTETSGGSAAATPVISLELHGSLEQEAPPAPPSPGAMARPTKARRGSEDVNMGRRDASPVVLADVSMGGQDASPVVLMNADGPPVPLYARAPPLEAIAGWRLCVKGFGRGCPCCGDIEEVLQRTGSNAGRRGWRGALQKATALDAQALCREVSAGGEGGTGNGAFVDTHCHLEEVLQAVRRHTVAPSLNKSFTALTSTELRHWRTLGWVQDATSEDAAEEEASASSQAVPPNPMWEKSWVDLLPEEREAAEALGYEVESWDRNQWLLPRFRSWRSLSDEMRGHLAVLGEDEATWDHWSGGGCDSSGGSIVNCNDLRRWDVLSKVEQVAAEALGFTEGTWNSEEMADVDSTIRELFGPGFEGCVTQGCDADSLENAAMLARAHPKVFVSFGCHPKAAWSYDDELEQKLISMAKSCGSKTVAWGEFGLDYSHPHYGRLLGNRRRQKKVFIRQLQFAISMGYPLVVHSRAADRDTLRIMQQYVPKNWKVHVHSFRGSVEFMEALLENFEQAYIGVPGIVTMVDPDAHELCRRCPLERMVLETDAPYLPLNGHFLSHPGLVPEIIQRVSELKGRPVAEVFTVMRENARTIYGI